jgi:hypothetical protein
MGDRERCTGSCVVDEEGKKEETRRNAGRGNGGREWW